MDETCPNSKRNVNMPSPAENNTAAVDIDDQPEDTTTMDVDDRPEETVTMDVDEQPLEMLMFMEQQEKD